MPKPTPLWGNFIYHADYDVLAFSWLCHGGFLTQGYYHAGQAVEKYLKALALTIIDPDGKTETALNNRWLHTHDLLKLAARCASSYRFYALPETIEWLLRFGEFDQAARYPWVRQAHGNGFDGSDMPRLFFLIQRLRTDVPIKLDDYPLGMLVRGHHQGRPDLRITQREVRMYGPSVAALRRFFPETDRIVRW